MLNPKLTALIPDQPYPEFTNVGTGGSWHGRLYARLVRGFQGIGRRVWIIEPSHDQASVLNVEVTRIHSPHEAAKIVRRSVPNKSATAKLATYTLTATVEDEIQRVTARNREVRVDYLFMSTGPYIVEVVAFGSLKIDHAIVRKSLDATIVTLQSHIPHYQPGWGFLAGILWALVSWAPLLVGFILLFRVIEWVTPGSTAGPIELGLVAGLIGLGFLIDRWSVNRRSFAVWKDIINQGDRDGTIRRALASIGHPIPPSRTTNH